MPQEIVGDIVNNAATTSITGVKSSQLKGFGYGRIYSYNLTSNGYEIDSGSSDGGLTSERAIGVSFAPKVDVNIFASSPNDSIFYGDNVHTEENLTVSLLTKGCVYVPVWNLNAVDPSYNIKPVIGHYVFFHRITGRILTRPTNVQPFPHWILLKGTRVIKDASDNFIAAIRLTGQQ